MKRLISVLVVLVLLVLVNTDLVAQCPMCSMAAESNLKAGGTAGRGLNSGILYLYVMPYLITATIAYLWFKNREKTA